MKFLPKEELQRICELPDPFVKEDGSSVQSAEEWTGQREYLKEMLAHYMYGHMPPAPTNTKGELLYSRKIYGGKAIAETIRITFGPDDKKEHQVSMLVHMTRPVREGKVPVITWNQFKGRYGCPEEEKVVVEHGYAVAEFDKEDLAADSALAMQGPLAKAYPEYDWGAIAMWSWGHSRIIDYLAGTDYADMDKIAATGHSRGGKVALCAAIYDERIALCAASGSGCGGAGCYRYLGGRLGEGTGVCETAGSIADFFPFWWNDEFGKYGCRQTDVTRATMKTAENQMEAMKALISSVDPAKFGTTGDEEYLPFDLHTVKALIAPRALITTDGLGDTWANPYGTQITWMAADEVYQFLGADGKNAIHLREGGHEYKGSDWLVVADFCDWIFYGKEPVTSLIPTSYEKPDPNNPMAAMTSGRMDWRSERLHYGWRRPGAE